MPVQEPAHIPVTGKLYEKYVHRPYPRAIYADGPRKKGQRPLAIVKSAAEEDAFRARMPVKVPDPQGSLPLAPATNAEADQRIAELEEKIKFLQAEDAAKSAGKPSPTPVAPQPATPPVAAPIAPAAGFVAAPVPQQPGWGTPSPVVPPTK